MQEDKFKIVNLVKELIIRIDENLINFPKKEIELKKSIRTNSYDLLLLVYEGNITSDISRRITLIENSIARVKQLDFLINLCCDKQRLASKCVNLNSSNANFNVRNVNSSNMNANNLANSNGNTNNNSNGVCPLASNN